MPVLAKKKSTKSLAVFFYGVIFFFLLFPLTSTAAFTKQINYQGKLTDGSGVTVTDGSRSIEFNLYSASSGGSSLWTETQTVTTSGAQSLGYVAQEKGCNVKPAYSKTLGRLEGSVMSMEGKGKSGPCGASNEFDYDAVRTYLYIDLCP
jgi:hypothetical protein